MSANVSEVEIWLARGMGVLKWGYLPVGLTGLLTNLLVIYITIKPGLVEREFKWLILNLSLVDTMASLMFLGQSCAYFLHGGGITYPGALCSVQGFVFYYNAFSIFWILFPVTVNRFVNVFAPQRADMFTPRFMLGMCVLIDALPLLQVASLGFFGDWGQDQVTGSCGLLEYNGPTRALYNQIYALHNALNWAVFAVTFSLNAAFHMKIRKHLSVVSTLDDKQRLKETQDLVRATLLQVLTPAALQLPVTMMDVLTETLIEDTMERLIFQLKFLAPLILMLAVNPTADALLSLYVLKPYRNAVVGFWKRFTGQQPARVTAAKARGRVGGAAVGGSGTGGGTGPIVAHAGGGSGGDAVIVVNNPGAPSPRS